MAEEFDSNFIDASEIKDTFFHLIIKEVNQTEIIIYFLVFLGILLISGGLLTLRGPLSRRLQSFVHTMWPSDQIDKSLVNEAAETLVSWLSILVAYWAWSWLNLSDSIKNVAHWVFAITFTLIGVRFFSILANLLLNRLLKSQSARGGAMPLMPIIRIGIWCLGLVFLLDALGFQVGSLLAGLGIMGLAIGLASKAILEDFFSYLVILMDKPFVIGDLVQINSAVGRVEHIGIKTTRIRTVNGEVKIVPNGELTSRQVGHYDPEAIEEDSFSFGVSYDTPLELLRRIPSMVLDVAAGIDGISDVRAHFTGFGERSLVFLVAFNLTEKNSEILLNAKEQLHYDMFDRFAREGVKLAGMN